MIHFSDLIRRSISASGVLVFSATSLYLAIAAASCEEPSYSFENPADPDSLGYTPPAVFFWPDSISISQGFTDTVDVYALEIDSLAGAYIGVEYHWGSLTIDTVLSGNFFASTNESEFFIAEDNQGLLDIFVFYLPDDKTYTNGTGSIAEIVFKAEEKGTFILEFADSTEVRKPENISILLNDMGQGLIHVE